MMTLRDARATGSTTVTFASHVSMARLASCGALLTTGMVLTGEGFGPVVAAAATRA
jgi:hypothetical protein